MAYISQRLPPLEYRICWDGDGGPWQSFFFTPPVVLHSCLRVLCESEIESGGRLGQLLSGLWVVLLRVLLRGVWGLKHLFQDAVAQFFGFP